MQISNKGFSLIEILIWILIVSMIMIAAFQTLSSVWIAKIKIIEQAEIEKQAFFSSERFFELIKKWGTIDYEEYWNRYSYNTDYLNGHFDEISGFWNFGRTWIIGSNNYWARPYHCISNWWWASMGTWWCLEDNNINFMLSATNVDRSGQLQRYYQYEKQFIDRNSDNDGDNWDEDGVNGIIWDDDDLFLGIWPAAFNKLTTNHDVWELYLISNNGKERTYFRWRVEELTWWFVPTWAVCDLITDPSNPIWEACNGTIEMLKLVWEDYGFDHDWTVVDIDGSQWDGLIDTWFIHPDYASGDATIIAGSNTDNYWQAIFPSNINIKEFEINVYPKKDLNLSWRDSDPSILVSPYIQVKYIIEPSLEIKAKIRWTVPSVDIATTISLSNLDIK